MITGYTSRLTVRAGDSIQAFVHCDAAQYHVETVRLTGRETSGGRSAHEPMPLPIDGQYAGQQQRTRVGSSASTSAVPWPFGHDFSVSFWVHPTADHGGVLRISTADGSKVLDLAIRDGHLVVDGAAAEPVPLLTWTRVSVDATCDIEAGSLVEVTWAADSFDGRLARPVIEAADGSARWSWHLGADPDQPVVPGVEPGTPPLQLTNSPLRSVTGPEWDGSVDHPLLAPDHYDAAHFHSDDITDAGWDASFDVLIPASTRSGVYAFRLSADGEDDDFIPFVVTSAPPARSARVALVLPTWTYLAYGNWRTYSEDIDARAAYFGERREPNATDLLLEQHSEFGRCFYDVHADGSPVCHSSYLRPLLNMRPDYTAGHAKGYRHFSADLRVLGWLADRGIEADVLTDHDLHECGADAISGYDVVLTGGHPEYCSSAMLDAYEDYLDAGGHLMYLGGNGFYWVTAALGGEPHVLEMRRGHNGIRRWDTQPGEEHLSTGELGGLWRYRGRAPNRLVGVGMSAQGFDAGSGYVRSDAGTGRFAWVFDGVGDGVIGLGEGPLGGAAGDEIDCSNPALGTPPGTVTLASSQGHSDLYLLAIENTTLLYPGVEYGGNHPDVRSDIVLVPRDGRFAVFSVGSIAWTNAMCAVPDGDASRITDNVLRRMLSGPIPTD